MKGINVKQQEVSVSIAKTKLAHGCVDRYAGLTRGTLDLGHRIVIRWLR
jgi:hypothetical protein